MRTGPGLLGTGPGLHPSQAPGRGTAVERGRDALSSPARTPRGKLRGRRVLMVTMDYGFGLRDVGLLAQRRGPVAGARRSAALHCPAQGAPPSTDAGGTAGTGTRYA